MDRLEALPVSIAYGRQLLPYEVADIAAISARIRSAVTIHRGQSRPGGREFYPRFEAVYDSIGNVASLDEPGEHWVTAEGLLRPGDRIDFTCRVWDPEGRSYETFWDGFNHNTIGPAATPFVGGFAWDVDESDIGESVHVQIRLVSARPYNRRGSDDESVRLIGPH